MSEGIRRMLAERAARDRALTSYSNRFAEGIERIKAAAPRLDHGFDSRTKWKPSEALLIAYCVLATSARPDGAEELLRQKLSGN